MSLPQVLAQGRGVRNHMGLSSLTVKEILTWADAHYRRTGEWPRISSGAIVEAPGETWERVRRALQDGLRGLQGGLSLARLLADHRGVRNPVQAPRLTYRQIRTWAEAHRRRTGQWPPVRSEPIPEAPCETWVAIDIALRRGTRGLPGGSSL